MGVRPSEPEEGATHGEIMAFQENSRREIPEYSKRRGIIKPNKGVYLVYRYPEQANPQELQMQGQPEGQETFRAIPPKATEVMTLGTTHILCQVRIQGHPTPPPRFGKLKSRGLDWHGHTRTMNHALPVAWDRKRYLVQLGGSEQVSGLQKRENVKQLMQTQMAPAALGALARPRLPGVSTPQAILCSTLLPPHRLSPSRLILASIPSQVPKLAKPTSVWPSTGLCPAPWLSHCPNTRQTLASSLTLTFILTLTFALTQTTLDLRVSLNPAPFEPLPWCWPLCRIWSFSSASP